MQPRRRYFRRKSNDISISRRERNFDKEKKITNFSFAELFHQNGYFFQKILAKNFCFIIVGAICDKDCFVFSCQIFLQNRSQSQICTTDEALIQAPHNSRDQNAKEPDLGIFVCQQIWWRINLTWLDLLKQHGLNNAFNMELEHYVGRLNFKQENVFIFSFTE